MRYSSIVKHSIALNEASAILAKRQFSSFFFDVYRSYFEGLVTRKNIDKPLLYAVILGHNLTTATSLQ